MEVRWRKGPGNEVVEHMHLLEKFKGKVKMGTLLSERDQRILESIFNPNLTFGNEIQADEATEELISNGHEETAAEKKARELEILAVENAEQGNVDVALNHLNEAVECCPNSASVYNNRAQVLLLKGTCICNFRRQRFDILSKGPLSLR
jgi:tetratricopeptide (TPR) repeat protein